MVFSRKWREVGNLLPRFLEVVAINNQWQCITAKPSFDWSFRPSDPGVGVSSWDLLTQRKQFETGDINDRAF